MTLPVGAAAAGMLGVRAPTRVEITQALTIMLVVAGVSLAVFIWAAFFRKPRRHHRHHHYRYPQSADGARRNPTAEKPLPVPRRKRLRRREHRPRNPTLAEAGGLPPERADQPEPPAAPVP